MTEPQLVVVGASGSGRTLADIALDLIDQRADTPFSEVVVVDDNPSTTNIARLVQLGVRYVGTAQRWLMNGTKCYFTIGLGDSRKRQALAADFMERGHEPATLIAPTARVSRSARIGAGSFISPGVDISANASLGTFVHVLANSAISHDCTLGDYVNLSPGAVLAGNCRVGNLATIGAGATVIQSLTVGAESMVGAGACVVHDVPPNTTVKGVPARP